MTPADPNANRRPPLDTLIAEAKAEHAPEVDWSKVEAKLFPRIEREARAQAALGAYAGPKRSWIAAAVLIAAAAAVPLFFHRAETSAFDRVSLNAPRPVAATVLEKDRNAVIHLTGATAARDLAKGDSVTEGDVVEVHAGRAIFARAEPRGVTWSLEDNAQVEVRSAGSTLVVALTKGAVEAQVTPVAMGEAFAIDVEGSRVAVHGTHLRVERQGTRAIVDLREGVVSIGLPPKSGSTYGDLVTAPAHVEFDPADPHGTLKVSHEPSRVRAAQTLSSPPPPAAEPTPVRAVRAPPPPPPSPPSVDVARQGGMPVASPAAPLIPSTPPRVASPVQVPPPAPPTEMTRQGSSIAITPAATVSSPEPPPAAPAQADPNPERTIVDQVRACARKHVEHADGVVITVSTRLELRVGDSGMVNAAIFSPPLAPEVQSCAASAIYGTRFAQPGTTNIAIDVTP